MTDLKSPSHPSAAVSEASEQKSPQATIPLKLYAAQCLLLLGVVFYASYGFANWLSAQRAPLPEIAFAWEQHIPFWAWTIVPYWSLNLFYACSVFVCKDRDELHGLIRQLLVAQAIAISCFMVFPLQFTWVKPPATGISGALFQALAGFDQPYNQAPSLHIILLIIIGHFYYSKFPKILRAVWLVWLGVIALSVLTTYQHHFIDIPTGVAVGALILWALPINSPHLARIGAQRSTTHHIHAVLLTCRSRSAWIGMFGGVVFVASVGRTGMSVGGNQLRFFRGKRLSKKHRWPYAFRRIYSVCPVFIGGSDQYGVLVTRCAQSRCHHRTGLGRQYPGTG